MLGRLSPFVAIALVIAPALLGAQTVHGVVTDGGTQAPLPGVVVLLVDSAGATATRALTNERGEYRLSSAAGTYRVRALRIGFRPVMSESVELRAGQEVERLLVLASVPVLLDTIRVVDRDVCRESSDSGDATAAIWEQARTALTAAQLTARLRTMSATLVVFERTLDPLSDRVQEHRSRITSGFTVRPWVSISADSIRRSGYVVENRNGTITYHAPDLDVLLSRMWLIDHCFRVARSKDPTLLGVAFEPTRDRSRVAEIRGVLWLDKKSSELRRMEFRYTNVSREQEDQSGGQMDFVRLANGAWAISRWHIRMPVVAVTYRVSGQRETSIKEIRVAGGELALAAQGNDTLFARPPLVLSGTVLDSAGSPASGARITIAGTSLAATADPRGRFAIRDVLPGEYMLEIRTSALDSVGGDAHVKWPVMFADGSARLMYRMPSARQIAKARAATVAGVVLDTAQQPVPAASVAIPALSLVVSSDAQGRFRLTDVPPGTHEVVVRRMGYGPLTAQVALGVRQTLERRIVLHKTVTLDSVVVTAAGGIPTFEEHRKAGFGHFLTRADLEKHAGRMLSDVLSQIPGVGVVRGSGRSAWIIARRGARSQQHGYRLDSADSASGAQSGACYSRVFLDNASVFRGDRDGESLFDINSISPDQVEAIEFYTGPAQIPLRYSNVSTVCGVLVLHTRRR